MKKLLFTAFLGLSLIAESGFAQTTAANFIGNDCVGNSHNFFNELDSGKVLVICWVMPCFGCDYYAQTAYHVVQIYQSSYPNRVFYYLVDDFANSPCSDLDSFATVNNMPNSIKFSDAAINMTYYGTAGMPKTVAIGGSSHTVFYNEYDYVDSVGLQSAIAAALAASGINDPGNGFYALQLFPNPADNVSSVSVNLEHSSAVNIEVYNRIGQNNYTVNTGVLSAGENKIQLTTAKLGNGVYFVKVTDINRSSVLKLVVSH